MDEGERGLNPVAMPPPPSNMMDYATLNAVVKELAPAMDGARLNRALACGPMEMVLILDARHGKLNLLISADARSSRMHLIDDGDIPQYAGKLHICSVLNERQRGGRLQLFEIIEWERVIKFTFSSQDIDGSRQDDTLVCELMGKYSNIILADSSGMIIAELKAVHAHQSSLRQVRAGLAYQLPPPETKLTPTLYSLDDFSSIFTAADKSITIAKLLVRTFKAMSPAWAEAITVKAGVASDASVDAISKEDINKLHDAYVHTLDKVTNGIPLSFEPGNEKFPINSYFAMHNRGAIQAEALESHRNALRRIIRDLQKSASKLKTGLDEDLAASVGREVLKRRADAVLAALHEIPKGAKKIELTDVHSPDGEKILIDLDPVIPPSKQAAKWYDRHRKLKRGEEGTLQRLRDVREKLDVLDEIETALDATSDLDAVNAVASRLEAAGLEVRFENSGKVTSRPSGTTYKVLRFRSSDGFDIMAGGNQKANDYLTQRLADGEDFWLHAQKIPGSHVIIRTRKKEVPESTLMEAAVIAAWHSDGREGSKVAVDYTKVKYVHKPPGAKAGYVTYKKQRTIRADPDEGKVKRLAVK